MTAVKICGLTREEDVALACALGAFAVGLNFAAESPRRLAVASARRLAEVVAPGVLRVGVFVSEPAPIIREAVEAVRLDVVQLHRPLHDRDLDDLLVPVIAVAHVGPHGADLPPRALLSRCRALLFDTRDPDRAGGTGNPFDWRSVIGQDLGLPILLAGGLDADNVGSAVRSVRPWAVDTASGVETSPGIKDAGKLRRFFEAVREADAA